MWHTLQNENERGNIFRQWCVRRRRWQRPNQYATGNTGKGEVRSDGFQTAVTTHKKHVDDVLERAGKQLVGFLDPFNLWRPLLSCDGTRGKRGQGDGQPQECSRGAAKEYFKLFRGWLVASTQEKRFFQSEVTREEEYVYLAREVSLHEEDPSTG